MSQVKYAYAYGSDGVLINIGGVPKDRTKRDSCYTCLSCGEQMIARHGEKLSPCFAHKPNDACSGETYLHKLGKELFFQTYSRCLKNGEPFELLVPEACWCDECSGLLKGMRCETTSKKTVNLINWYENISIEKSVDGFVADILLESSVTTRKPLLVEIAVTHSLSSEKRQSGLRITEIVASSEDDLSFLRNSKISVGANPGVKFYNFKANLKHDPVSPDQCQIPIQAFVIFKSDKCLLKNFTVSEFNKFHNARRSQLKYYEYEKDHSVSDFFAATAYEFFIQRAFRRGVKFKNCFLCRYHAIGWKKAIFCKFLKEEYPSRQATECEFFRI